MLIYHCIAITVNLAAAFIFCKDISISALSLIPLILIGLMLFQGHYFKNEKTENGFRTAYGSNLTEDEENALYRTMSVILLAAIPLMIPFVLFFPPLVKLLSVIIYMASFMLGSLVYRIRIKQQKERK